MKNNYIGTVCYLQSYNDITCPTQSQYIPRTVILSQYVISAKLAINI